VFFSILLDQTMNKHFLSPLQWLSLTWLEAGCCLAVISQPRKCQVNIAIVDMSCVVIFCLWVSLAWVDPVY